MRGVALVAVLAAGCAPARAPRGAASVDAEPRFRIEDPVTGLHGLIDRQGRVVVEPRYTVIGEYSEGLAAAERDDRFFYLDGQGREVLEVPARVEERVVWRLGPFAAGRAAIHSGDDELVAFIERGRKVVIAVQRLGLSRVEPFTVEGLAAAQRKDGKWGYIDIAGDWAIAPRFQVAESFSEGRATVGVADVLGGELWGVINTAGEWVIPAKWRSRPSIATDGLIGVHDQASEALIAFDLGGKERFRVAGNDPDGRFECNDGRCIVWLASGAGFVDYRGNLVIPAIYWSVYRFSEGLALAIERQRGPYGFLRPDGSWAIPPTYRFAESLRGGLAAVVTIDGTKAYVDRTGALVWPPP